MNKNKIIRVIGDFHLSDITPRSWKSSYFENCMHELTLVSEGADAVIVLGDFFDKPTIPEAHKTSLMHKLSEIKSRGCTIYTIVGNHDLIGYNMSESHFARTTINLLSEASKTGGGGYFNVIKEQTEIFGITFVPYHGCKGGVLSAAPNEDAVLLSHAYFNNPIDELLNIPVNVLSEKGYKYAFFGHDHEPHKSILCGKTVVLRPGSFTRSSSHAFNLNRKACYYELTVGDEVKVSDLCELSTSLDSGDLFRAEYFEKKKQDKTFETNLTQLFSGLSEKAGETTVFSLSSILAEVKTPKNAVAYLKEVHQDLGINWS